MPRLRILAGPSTTDLKPIRADSGEALDVSSDLFDGKIAVYIKNFADPDGKVQDSAYFEHESRKDVTWSIQVQGVSDRQCWGETRLMRSRLGRFLQEHNADDVLFGNVFDKPLPIPWGFSTILGFMQCVYAPPPSCQMMLRCVCCWQVHRPHAAARPDVQDDAVGAVPAHLHHAVPRARPFRRALPAGPAPPRRHLHAAVHGRPRARGAGGRCPRAAARVLPAGGDAEERRIRA